MTSQNAPRLAAVPAAALAAILGAAPLPAAATWTVQPGGPVSMRSGTLTLKDTRTGALLTCPSVPMRATLKRGSGLRGAGIGSITSVSCHCGSGLPQPPGMMASGLPWDVNVTAYNAMTGVVTGNVSGVRIRLTATPSDPCTAVVDGTSGSARDGIVTVTYTNGTAELKTLITGGNLHFYQTQHCAGLLNNGDPATISVTLTVSPKQAITSR